jgi:hypothetical protein
MKPRNPFAETSTGYRVVLAASSGALLYSQRERGAVRAATHIDHHHVAPQAA